MFKSTKFEIRNKFEYKMIKIQNLVSDIEIFDLEFVSCFVLRASNFFWKTVRSC
ncbi:hypothetical protein D1AOALGA4SA_5293 [Olavius algarvensis Delta 1 endosymbiont]|nr:hypothetical protein D1AOALGA4SA_5293 [Olavius algarvensis Delta 1 endosymbiont]